MRLCKDCKHYQPYYTIPDGKCLLSIIGTNLVDGVGEYDLASTQRQGWSWLGYCGKKGKYWESKYEQTSGDAETNS